MFWNKSKASEPVATARADSLILYHFDACFYCRMVRRAIDRLGIDVEYRNILENPNARKELIEVRGRSTVPVLRGRTGDDEWWMPESRDIVKYLEEHYG